MNDFIRTPASHPIEGTGSTYRHTFGGELPTPVFPPGGTAPCHLLYTIDTHDPLFPVRIPGVRFLPLLYCQQYNAAAMSYRVHGDQVIVDWIESLDWSKDFPYDENPAAFPRRDITLVPADQEKLRQLEEKDEDTMDLGSRFGGWHWLCQGIPRDPCQNPQCEKGPLDVFGVIYDSPVPGVQLWWEGAFIEIIYQICRACSSIQVCNRMT